MGLRELQKRFDLYRQNKRRFETNRTRTGKAKCTFTDYFIGSLMVIKEEWNVETCLPSHDITDEYHLEWTTAYRKWYWFWR